VSNETVVATDAEPGEGSAVLAVEMQIRALKRQLAQREQALALLNRRLLRLERGEDSLPAVSEVGVGDMAAHVLLLRAQMSSLHDENDALRNELHWLRHSKIFRWSRPFREAFYAMRRVFRRR
jgi:phage protein D